MDLHANLPPQKLQKLIDGLIRKYRIPCAELSIKEIHLGTYGRKVEVIKSYSLGDAVLLIATIRRRGVLGIIVVCPAHPSDFKKYPLKRHILKNFVLSEICHPSVAGAASAFALLVLWDIATSFSKSKRHLTFPFIAYPKVSEDTAAVAVDWGTRNTSVDYINIIKDGHFVSPKEFNHQINLIRARLLYTSL